jgi:hypothetical protein
MVYIVIDVGGCTLLILPRVSVTRDGVRIGNWIY